MAISSSDDTPQRAEAKPCGQEGSMGWICGHLGSPSSTVPGDLGLGICCPCPVNPSPGTDGWACHTVATGTPLTSLFTVQTLPGYLKVLIYAWIQSIFYLCLAWEKFIGKSVRGMAMSGSFRDHRKAGSRALGRPCPSLCSSGSPSCCSGRLWAMCLVGVPPTHPPSR